MTSKRQAAIRAGATYISTTRGERMLGIEYADDAEALTLIAAIETATGTSVEVHKSGADGDGRFWSILEIGGELIAEADPAVMLDRVREHVRSALLTAGLPGDATYEQVEAARRAAPQQTPTQVIHRHALGVLQNAVARLWAAESADTDDSAKRACGQVALGVTDGWASAEGRSRWSRVRAAYITAAAKSAAEEALIAIAILTGDAAEPSGARGLGIPTLKDGIAQAAIDRAAEIVG